MRGTDKNAQRVLCVSNGTVYASIKAASRELGISAGSISAAVAGKRRRAGGYIVEPYDHEISGSLQDYCTRRLIEEALRI